MQRKKGPWSVLASKIVYKNPWMEVQEDTVITPGGKKSIYGTVAVKAGAGIIPLDADGNVYLAKEYRYGGGKTTIELIGGGQEKGQSPLQAAKRELLEEAGFKAKKWTLLGKSDAFTSFLSAAVWLYLAEGLVAGKATPEENEVITIVKMPLKKALQMILQGKITHAATIAALFKVAALKKHPLS